MNLPVDKLVATGLIPDFVLRSFINKYLNLRLSEVSRDYKNKDNYLNDLVSEFKNGPIAIETDEANNQHYMVPPKFFEYCLGKHLKYSCCHWEKATNLDEAEKEILEITIERSGIKDGDRILELGHGWGAITLFLGEKFPNSEILAVSNSSRQGEYILEQAKNRGITNIRIQTADMNDLELDEKFDRVISIEMFEHMRNYHELLKRISSWLNPEGTLFVHIFTHKDYTYKYEVVDHTDWMSKYFFSGGIMPGQNIFNSLQEHMTVKDQWKVNGKHYAKTCRAWLNKTDRYKSEIMELFRDHYSQQDARKWFHFWRVFFMSCEELFNYDNGNEWFVTHYLLQPNKI